MIQLGSFIVIVRVGLLLLLFIIIISLFSNTTIAESQRRRRRQQRTNEKTFKKKKIRIAVIGGGISGSFVSKYLTDYDQTCRAIDSITIFDPYTYLPSSSLSSTKANHNQEPLSTTTTTPMIYPFIQTQKMDKDEEEEGIILNPLSSLSSSNEQQQRRRRVRIGNNKELHNQDKMEEVVMTTPSSSSSSSLYDHSYQGSRVSTLLLSDGTSIELGASIIYQGNTLIMEMIRNDPTLQVGEPHVLNNDTYKKNNTMNNNTSNNNTGEYSNTSSWGIFNGFQGSSSSSSWPLFIPSTMSSFQKQLLLLWRYHYYNLYRIQRATNRAYQSFLRIYDLLNNNNDDDDDSSTTYKSPDDIWKTVGLWKIAHCSFDELLNHILGSSSSSSSTWFGTMKKNRSFLSLVISWWRKIFDSIMMGGVSRGGTLLRLELLTAMNLVNNNQGNNRMTGLAGLVNFLASKGPLLSIVGGNYKLIQSAIHQANQKREQSCNSMVGQVTSTNIIHIPTRVKTIISEAHNPEQGIELYDVHGNPLGDSFDIVILAAPLQFANIDFLVKGSLFDSDLLYTMPLHGRVMVNEDESFVDANEHGHYHAIQTLPPSAQRHYTQVITTVVANATLQASYLNVDARIRDAPSTVVFTEIGQKALHGISAIRMLNPADGLYKIFSSTSLDLGFLRQLFGDGVTVEYVQTWGGTHGGATPNFNGGKLVDSPPFLLFDSVANGESSDLNDSTIYYTNGMETAIAAMEISAIGAKAVAKMIASRYGFLHPEPPGNVRDEEL